MHVFREVLRALRGRNEVIPASCGGPVRKDLATEILQLHLRWYFTIAVVSSLLCRCCRAVAFVSLQLALLLVH